jgi:2-polyprenyl-3-methyl-5-hydroxy-6-metoxy-1,4-benzoquinol methylase
LILEEILKYTDYDVFFVLTEATQPLQNEKLIYNPAKSNLKYDSEEYINIKQRINSIDGRVAIVTDKSRQIYTNRLLWECDNVTASFCIDLKNHYEPERLVTKSDKLLWDLQAYKAKENDFAYMSGWNNSYNNEPFRSEEIEEYVNNAHLKLSTYINDTTDMLEVGVGSGMFAFKMAGFCNSYDGCDISQNVLDILKNEAVARKINNMSLYCLGADEIDKIGRKYDVILMSSVTEYFSGYNYLRLVVEKLIEVLKDKGVILCADIFDLDLKEDYRQSVNEYAGSHPGCIFKKDFSHELFVPRKFWLALKDSFPAIRNIAVTNKIGFIDNEINRFRYDVLIEVDKTRDNSNANKCQFGFYNGKPICNRT